jgi:hypothetical protein
MLSGFPTFSGPYHCDPGQHGVTAVFDDQLSAWIAASDAGASCSRSGSFEM